MIFFPAASIPVLVTLGPSTIVIPSFFTTVSPAVTLSTLISFARLNVNLLSPDVIPILPSVFAKSNVSPGLTVSAADVVVPFVAVKFQPFSAVSFTVFN